MDVDAFNFDQSAEKDNGTCEYEGSAIIWWDESTKNHFVITEPYNSVLSFYIDDEIFYEITPYAFWTAAPNCSDSTGVPLTFYLGGIKTGIANIKITVGVPGNYTSTVYSEWAVEIFANQCTTYKMNY